MDIEKLIRRLRNDANAYRNGKTLGRAFADQEDVLDNAATALSTLQAENEKLRNEAERAYMKVVAELEQVKRERDAAVEMIREWEKFDTYLLIHNFITPEKWRGQKKED